MDIDWPVVKHYLHTSCPELYFLGVYRFSLSVVTTHNVLFFPEHFAPQDGFTNRKNYIISLLWIFQIKILKIKTIKYFQYLFDYY